MRHRKMMLKNQKKRYLVPPSDVEDRHRLKMIPTTMTENWSRKT